MTDRPTIPEGWREMAPDELVSEGDRCCVLGRFWPSSNWHEGNDGRQGENCCPYIRRIEQPQQQWIPVSEGLPNKEDGKSCGYSYDVTCSNGVYGTYVEEGVLRSRVIELHDNGRLLAWKGHRLPDPYVPPEPEKRDHRIIKDGGIERRYVEERDGDPDPDAARELVDYIVTRSKYAPCDWIRLLALAAKCRRTDDEAG